MIPIEYKGKKYSSIRALAVAYGKNPVAVYARLKQTNDIEFALNQEKKWSLKTIKDHLGNEFRSLSAKCKHYGISVSGYKRRIKNGYTEEQALTETAKINCKRQSVEYKGMKFKSISEACEKLNVKKSRYSYLSGLGLTINDILEMEGK